MNTGTGDAQRLDLTLQMVAVQASGELERLQAAEKLQASEREFRLLAEAMPQIVWICQPDGMTIYFNQQWVEYTGLSLEESYGHGWNKPFHPDDQQRAWDAWQQAVHHHATYSLECRLRRADGRYRWWLVRGVPVRDADGKILKWFGTCTDIEELKQGEATLLESQQMLRESQRIAGLGSYVLDIVSGQWRSSDVLDEVFGIDADYDRSVAGWTALIHPDDRPIMVDHLSREVLGLGCPFNKEYRIIRPADQEVRWLHGLGKLELDDQGEPQRMLGTIQDITSRKRAEAELRESELKHAKMLANIGDVIVIIDSAGINRYKSPNLERLFGWQPEEVVGRDTFENIHPDDEESARKFIGRLLAEPNATGTAQCRYQCKDGSYKWIGFTGVNLQHDPNIRGVLGNYHDITERKQAEAMLQEKLAELAVSNAELERFNRAMVGRELRMIELKQEINGLCRRLGEPPLHAVEPSDLSDVSDISAPPPSA